MYLLSADSLIEDSEWLSELCAQVSKDDIGIAGAWQQFPDHTTQSAGLVLKDGCSGVMQAFRGLNETDIGHMGRAHLIQRFQAVNRHCFVTRRNVYDSVGGFDCKAYPNHLWNVDYCLRARMDAGQYAVWSPYAKVCVRECLPLPAGYDEELLRLGENWGAIVGSDPYFNANLDLNDPRFFLSWPPRSGGAGA